MIKILKLNEKFTSKFYSSSAAWSQTSTTDSIFLINSSIYVINFNSGRSSWNCLDAFCFI
jgi:hypothetical protein